MNLYYSYRREGVHAAMFKISCIEVSSYIKYVMLVLICIKKLTLSSKYFFMIDLLKQRNRSFVFVTCMTRIYYNV